MDVRVLKVDNLTNSAQPLQITYESKGARRLVDRQASARACQPLRDKRETASFRKPGASSPSTCASPSVIQDAVRFKLPEGIVIESAPAPDNGSLKGVAGFATSSKEAANSVTLYRNVTVAKTFFMPDDYPDLRSFLRQARSQGSGDVNPHPRRRLYRPAAATS